MNIEAGKKYLITTDAWFYAPDGRQYRSVFGTVHDILDADSALGIKTNRNSTNWYVRVGGMIVAGCQIHYAIQADEVHCGEVDDFHVDSGKPVEYRRPSYIYSAD